MSAVVFQTGNPGRLGLPGPLTIFMVVVFALPAAMLVATTWQEIPQTPALVIAWVAALFPLAVLFVLKRLMSRYALRVEADGTVEAVLPFARHRLAAGALKTIRTRQLRDGNGAVRRWVDFLGAGGRPLATVAANAFTGDQWGAFLDAARRAIPDLSLETTS